MKEQTVILLQHAHKDVAMHAQNTLALPLS